MIRQEMRKLGRQKLKAGTDEFDHMAGKGICRISKSVWSSPLRNQSVAESKYSDDDREFLGVAKM